MLVQAILIGLIAMFVTFEWMFGTNLGSRPIITGMLVGLVMGDLKTGIILGATLEMVFIGSIALNTGIATGAVQIITEEIPTPIDDVVENVKKIRESGKDHFIVIVSEGYGNPVEIATQIQEKTGIDSRATILGHVQRGGNPTLKDRVNATRMGYYAVKLLEEGKTNRVVALQQGNLVDYDIQEALKMKKPLDMDLYNMMMEISF